MDIKLNFNEFDPKKMVPTTSAQQTPAYNPNMTEPQEPPRKFIVRHDSGVQTAMIQQAPVVYGPKSLDMTCPWCKNEISTKVENKPKTKTHISAIILCFVGCCMIPYICSSCQSQEHYCPNCKRFLGSYEN